MIGFLRGKVAELSLDCCFLDVQGVGYRIFLSSATRDRLHLGDAALYAPFGAGGCAASLWFF